MIDLSEQSYGKADAEIGVEAEPCIITELRHDLGDFNNRAATLTTPADQIVKAGLIKEAIEAGAANKPLGPDNVGWLFQAAKLCPGPVILERKFSQSSLQSSAPTGHIFLVTPFTGKQTSCRLSFRQPKKMGNGEQASGKISMSGGGVINSGEVKIGNDITEEEVWGRVEPIQKLIKNTPAKTAHAYTQNCYNSHIWDGHQTDMRIPDSLVESLLKKSGQVTPEQLESLRGQNRLKKAMRDLAIANNIISEKDLTKLYAAEIDVPFTELNPKEIKKRCSNCRSGLRGSITPWCFDIDANQTNWWRCLTQTMSRHSTFCKSNWATTSGFTPPQTPRCKPF